MLVRAGARSFGFSLSLCYLYIFFDICVLLVHVGNMSLFFSLLVVVPFWKLLTFHVIHELFGMYNFIEFILLSFIFNAMRTDGNRIGTQQQ